MERSLNFATSPDAEGFTMPHKRPRTPRDPMSHRIIEKRRRDRMNNCLADLSHLIPGTYLKQGQGRIEKTEIIEMAISHIKHLQMLHVDQTKGGDTSAEKFYMGFRECMNEMMRFLVEKQNFNAADPICVQIMKHLQEQSQQYLPPTGLSKPVEPTTTVGQTLGTTPSESKLGMSVFDREVELTMRNVTAQEQTKSHRENGPTQDTVYNQTGRTEYRHLAGRSSPFNLFADDDLLNKDSANESVSSFSQNDSANASSYSYEYYKQQMIERNKEIYKFKNDIKSRFNQDLHSADPDANGWREQNQDEKDKKPIGNSPEVDCVSTKSNSPSDSAFDGNDSGVSSGHSVSRVGRSSNPPSHTHIPGFALHNSGTYYVPVIIHTSAFTTVFRVKPASDQTAGILHPISIPVSFGGACIPAQSQSPSIAASMSSTAQSQSPSIAASMSSSPTNISCCNSIGNNSLSTDDCSDGQGPAKKKKVPTATLR